MVSSTNTPRNSPAFKVRSPTTIVLSVVTSAFESKNFVIMLLVYNKLSPKLLCAGSDITAVFLKRERVGNYVNKLKPDMARDP